MVIGQQPTTPPHYRKQNGDGEEMNKSMETPRPGLLSTLEEHRMWGAALGSPSFEMKAL